MIEAVGVVVPARDERHRIGGCLRAIHRSLQRLPATVPALVCVVADRCADDTDRIVGAEFGTRPGRYLLPTSASLTIGEVRDLGIRHLLRELAGYPPDQVWLLNTDADSTVRPEWARRHLAHADRNAHAVAGTVELPGPAALPPVVQRRYAQLYSSGFGAARHNHVHGANLGVRGDAYLAVGGFPALSTGEDAALWHRLRAAGYRLACPADLPVRTSARTTGRARGGLADLLRSLHHPAPET